MDEQTLKWYCARDGVVLRTAQYHRQILGVGRLVGSTYILTDHADITGAVKF